MNDFVTKIDLINKVKLHRMDNIIDNSIDIKKPVISGVYFLIYQTRIVYIGSSYDVYLRMETHKKNSRLRFNKYFIHPIYTVLKVGKEKDALKELEKKYIIKYKPRFNFKDNPDYKNGKKEVLRTYLNEFKNLQEVVDLCEIKITTAKVSNALRNSENMNVDDKAFIEKAIMSRYKPSKHISLIKLEYL